MKWLFFRPLTRASALGFALVSGMAGCTYNLKLPTDSPYEVRMSPIEIKPRIPDPPSAISVTEEEGREEADRAKYKQVVQDRRNRNEEIRLMKAGGIIGETHEGLVKIVPEDLEGTGWETKLDYIVKTVEAENRDRNYLIKREADQRGKDPDDIRRNMWRQWQRRSFGHEWFEVEAPGGYRWIRKDSIPTETAAEED